MQQNIWQHIGIVYIPQSVKPAVLKIIILNQAIAQFATDQAAEATSFVFNWIMLWASSLGQASLDIKLWM